MTPQISVSPVNPSAETIRLGPLAVHFLITAEDSNGTVAAFELTVPGGQRLAAPAHSHDHYEETIYGIHGVLTWTVDGNQLDVGPGQALCIPRGAVHRFVGAAVQILRFCDGAGLQQPRSTHHLLWYASPSIAPRVNGC